MEDQMSRLRISGKRSFLVGSVARPSAKCRIRQIGSVLVGALWFVCLATTAHAGRDVCLNSSFGEQLVFRNVGVLRPGRSINLSGIYRNTVTTVISVRFDGSAMMS